jgi:hypothetical protein
MTTPAMENNLISLDLSTHIYRPLTQVFSFVATPENDFQWQYGTLDSNQISRGEMGVGTLFHVTGNFLGQRIESTYEVTEFVPNTCYGFQSRSGPLESHTLYTFEISKATTKLSMSARVSIGELFKPGDCTVEKKIKKQYRENLALLKGVLEADRIEKR